jgi:hypothetical protein
MAFSGSRPSLGFKGKVNHHDRVLFHDSDEQDDPDHRNDREFKAEELKGQQSAQSGAGQRGKNGNRMDQALVEHPENDIDSDQGGHNEDRLIRDRFLKNLGVPGESTADGVRKVQVAHGFVDDLRCAFESYSRRKIKRDGDRRELALVIDREGNIGNLEVSNAA